MNGSRRVWKEPRNTPSTMRAQPIVFVARGPSFLLTRAPKGIPRVSDMRPNGITCTASGVIPACARPSKNMRLCGAYVMKLPQQYIVPRIKWAIMPPATVTTPRTSGLLRVLSAIVMDTPIR